MIILDKKIVDRWNNVMNSIGCEHVTINTRLSELERNLEIRRNYYGTTNGINTEWMLKEAKYWLSCYYESGHCRCDERFESTEGYKVWVSETGKLKRLINMLEKNGNKIVVIFQ